jgi:hypothetical protein
MFQYGAEPADPKLHAKSLAEIKRGRTLMAAGAAVTLVGLFLPAWWLRVGGIGAGMGLWTVGMKQQMTAGVEAKIAQEGLTGILARCGAECIVAPLQVSGYGSVYNRNYMAGQNRYSGTHAPSFG